MSSPGRDERGEAGVSLARIRNYRRIVAEYPIPAGLPCDVTEVWVALVEAVEATRDYWRSGDDEAGNRVAAALEAFRG